MPRQKSTARKVRPAQTPKALPDGSLDTLADSISFAIGIQEAVMGVQHVTASNMEGLNALLETHIKQLREIGERMVGGAR